MICAVCLEAFDLAPIRGVIHGDGTCSLLLESGPVPWICTGCESSFPDIYKHVPIRERADG